MFTNLRIVHKVHLYSHLNQTSPQLHLGATIPGYPVVLKIVMGNDVIAGTPCPDMLLDGGVTIESENWNEASIFGIKYLPSHCGPLHQPAGDRTVELLGE